MPLVEIAYLGLVLGGLLVALWIIGFRHVVDVSSPAGWFVLMVVAAYFLRPLIFFVKGDWVMWDSLGLPPFEEIGLTYGAVVFLFVVSFALGYGPSQPLQTYIRNGRRLPPPAPKVILFVLLCFILLGFHLASKYRPVPGLGEGVRMDLVKGWTVYTDTTGYLVHAINLVPACGMILYGLTGNLAATGIVVVPYILLQFYHGWGRSHFLLPLIAFLALASLQVRTLRVPRWHIVVLFGLLFCSLPILAVLGSDRDFFKKPMERKERQYRLEKAQERWTASDSADITGFTNTAFYIVHSGKTFPHSYCYGYVYTFFIQPIPRMFWKDKPVPSDFDPREGPRGMTSGPLGEPYHQLGWFGCLLMLVHGWMVKRGLLIFANLGRPSQFGAYGFLMAYGVWGPFGWVTSLPFYLAPILVVYLIERKYFMTALPKKKRRTVRKLQVTVTD